MIVRQLSFAAVAALSAAGWAAFAEPKDDLTVARGAHVAALECAACHAVGPTGESPAADAPTFRDLRLRYNPISLERRLSALPASGHPVMPPRALGAADVSDLVAYIQSLEPDRRKP
ncbi:MAG: c-type cytochrome [Phenylobacterium sp.]